MMGSDGNHGNDGDVAAGTDSRKLFRERLAESSRPGPRPISSVPPPPEPDGAQQARIAALASAEATEYADPRVRARSRPRLARWAGKLGKLLAAAMRRLASRTRGLRQRALRGLRAGISAIAARARRALAASIAALAQLASRVRQGLRRGLTALAGGLVAALRSAGRGLWRHRWGALVACASALALVWLGGPALRLANSAPGRVAGLGTETWGELGGIGTELRGQLEGLGAVLHRELEALEANRPAAEPSAAPGPQPTSRPGAHRLAVVTDPPGANVQIGELSRRSPVELELPEAPDDAWQVQIDLPGHRPEVREVRAAQFRPVGDHQELALQVELQPRERRVRARRRKAPAPRRPAGARGSSERIDFRLQPMDPAPRPALEGAADPDAP